MKKATYLKLGIKRCSKTYPAIFAITLVTILAIVLTAVVIMDAGKNSKEKTKLTIGVVGDTSETYLGVGIAALENFDSSKYSIEFEETTERRARRDLKRRDISGYLRVPDNFVENILYGRNNPAEYVVLDDSTGFETALMSEFASLASDWVLMCQSAVYGMQGLTEDYGDSTAKKNMGKNTRAINTMNMEDVLGRNKTYDTETIGIADSLSLEAYYLCGIIVFFLLIWGISCNKLLIRKDYALFRVLYSRGIKSFRQIFSDYVSYLLLTLGTLIFLAIVFGITAQSTNLGIRELRGANIVTCVGFVIKLLPVIVMFTLMHMMMYEMAAGIVNSIVLQLFVSLALAYISGCFYPNYFFPETVQKIADVLPGGAGFSYVRKTLVGAVPLKELGINLAYSGAFALVTVYLRRLHIMGEQ